MSAGLRDELADMIATDKATRTRLWEALQAHGRSSEEFEGARRDVAEATKQNVARLVSILETHGWPGKSMVGEEASTGAFLVLQHADLSVQIKYLPTLRSAAESGEADLQDLALLQDKILVKQGKPQTYGSQLRMGADGKPELCPIEDEAHVDDRRASMGLPPLAEYLERAGMKHLIDTKRDE